jgi:outer membrane protein OmpA-like peptidoglycan-associated protein
MTRTFLSTGLLAATLLTGGCATKKYVQNTTAPIQAKVDQVGDATNKNGQQIQQTRTDLTANINGVDEKAQSGISAAKESAMTAQNTAQGAMTKANDASDLAHKDSEEIKSLRQQVSNLDDYKQVGDLTIPFAFNKYTLTDKDKADLDTMVTSAASNKRYFVAVEGFTDRTGSRQYNEALSRKRADAVTEYLVAKHDIHPRRARQEPPRGDQSFQRRRELFPLAVAVAVADDPATGAGSTTASTAVSTIAAIESPAAQCRRSASGGSLRGARPFFVVRALAVRRKRAWVREGG